MDELFRAAFTRADIPLFLVDGEGKILHCNRAFALRVATTVEAACGADLSRYLVQEDCVELKRMLREAMSREPNRSALHVRLDGGASLPEQCLLTISWISGQTAVSCGIGTLQDSALLREKEGHGGNRIRHDPVTELPTCDRFVEWIDQGLSHVQLQGPLLAVMTCNLDGFHRINDTMGYETGDRLLKILGQRLAEELQPTGFLGRLGGDKFGIAVRGLPDEENAAAVADRILKTIRRPVDLGGEAQRVTASIGIAVAPRDGQEAEPLLKNAEMAMRQAKEGGGNCRKFYCSNAHAKVVYTQTLKHLLRGAMAKRELFLHFQLQRNLATGRWAGTEALLRWRNGTLGLIGPGEFIPPAEESDLILKIGEWVLFQACRQAKAWHQAGLAPLRVAVNVSARQFRQPDFVDQVGRILRETGLDADKLELELTESSLVDNPRQAREILNRLRRRGVEIAVDDFGTGYSSLSYLKDFPINRLKIDRAFIRDILNRPADAKIVAAIILLAHTLGLEVTAEGVETPEQVNFLRQHGCDEIQGFLFARPMAAADVENLIRERPLEEGPVRPLLQRGKNP